MESATAGEGGQFELHLPFYEVGNGAPIEISSGSFSRSTTFVADGTVDLDSVE